MFSIYFFGFNINANMSIKTFLLLLFHFYALRLSIALIYYLKKSDEALSGFVLRYEIGSWLI